MTYGGFTETLIFVGGFVCLFVCLLAPLPTPLGPGGQGLFLRLVARQITQGVGVAVGVARVCVTSFSFNRCFRLNDLELNEVIGHGFYGSVYKARDLQRRNVM